MKLNYPFYKYSFSILVFIVFLIFIQKYIGWEIIFLQLGKVSLKILSIIFLILTLSYITRALRIYFFFISSYPDSFTTYLKISIFHNFLNNFLPMRTGEISYPILLNKYLGINIKISTKSLIWFRILDLFSLTSIIVFALNTYLNQPASIRAFSFIIFIMPLILFYSAKHYSKTDYVGNNILFKLVNFLKSSIPSNKKDFISSWLLTQITWALKLSIFTFFISFSLQIDLTRSLLAIISSEFTSILPIHSFAGFGTYEAGIISVLASQNLTNIKDVVATSTILHIIILTSTMLSAMVFLFIPNKNESS